MTFRKLLRGIGAGLAALGALSVLGLSVSPDLRAQATRIMFLADGAGNPIGSTSTSGVRGLNVYLKKASDGSDITYASEDRNSGAITANTLRVVQADDGGTGCAILSTASTNATNCKASPGLVRGIYVINTTTTTYYLRMYNLASAPTASSSTGFVQSYPIPPAGAAGQAGGFSFPFPLGGITYSTGIGYVITAGSGSTDNTNAAAGVFGTLVYK